MDPDEFLWHRYHEVRRQRRRRRTFDIVAWLMLAFLAAGVVLTLYGLHINNP